MRLHNYSCSTKHNVFVIKQNYADFSLFIGARSDGDQADWFWNNETRVTDPTYPMSDTSACQQMSWPLTYNDGINLRRKRCEDEAYFICQHECELIIILLRCFDVCGAALF